VELIDPLQISSGQLFTSRRLRLVRSVFPACYVLIILLMFPVETGFHVRFKALLLSYGAPVQMRKCDFSIDVKLTYREFGLPTWGSHL
jgi:hypothetical protein